MQGVKWLWVLQNKVNRLLKKDIRLPQIQLYIKYTDIKTIYINHWLSFHVSKEFVSVIICILNKKNMEGHFLKDLKWQQPT